MTRARRRPRSDKSRSNEGLAVGGSRIAAAAAARAAGDRARARRSGYDFAGPETRAMQDEDTANPGCLGCCRAKHCGRPRPEQPAGPARLPRRRANQHEGRSGALSGIRAALARLLDLEGRINRCRTEHQGAPSHSPGRARTPRLDGLCRLPVARTADRPGKKPSCGLCSIWAASCSTTARVS